MYALIIVIAVLSPAGGAVTPVGVTSQVLGKFKKLISARRLRVSRASVGPPQI